MARVSDNELYQLAEQVGRLLKAKSMMLGTAESFTGGWTAERITAVPGSSAWFDRGFVTYTNQSKQDMLGVSAVVLEQFGAVSQNHAVVYYTDNLWRDGKKETIEANKNNGRQKYTHALFTEFALDFIRRHQKEPFFLYVAFTIPHAELEVPSLEPYADKDWPEKSRIFAAMITRLDRSVGQILDLLKQLGLDENTLVFFTSDNGSPEGRGAIFNSNGVFKGKKGTLNEGGLRAPLIVRWPSRIPAGRVSDARKKSCPPAELGDVARQPAGQTGDS